jgi:hypothetical protein
MAKKPVSDGSGIPFSGYGGSVTVKGREYAVGLVWEEAPEKKSVLTQARKLAPRHGSDLVCARKPDHGQFALGSTANGHKAGMRSLAGIIADGIEGSFLAGFEVEGGYYVVASRDNQILAGWDRFLTEKQEAQEMVAELSYGAAWDTKIAPADFQIDDSNATPLDVAIGGSSTKARLQSVSQKGMYLRVGGVAVVAIIAVLGYQQYTAYELEQAQEAERQRLIDIQRQQIEEANRKPKPLPLPWIGEAYGYDTINLCVKQILATPVEVPGWNPLALVCTDDKAPGGERHLAVSLSLKRSNGTINWATASLNRLSPKPHINWDGRDGITAVWDSLPSTAREYKAGVKTRTEEEMERYLRLQFEELNQAVTLNSTQYRPPPPNQQAGKTFYPAHNILSFGFSEPQDPREFAALLAPLPVMTVQAVKLDIERMIWSVEGKAYEEVVEKPVGTAGPGKLGPLPPR